MASKKQKKIIPLDGDKLGMIGGTVGGTIVLIISFFLHTGNIVTTIIRVGWAFVICYGATFFLVRMILRTTLIDMVDQEKMAKAEAKRLKKEAENEAKSTEE